MLEGAERLVAGSKVEDSPFALTLPHPSPRTGGEVRVNSFPDCPAEARGEVLAAVREEGLEDHNLSRGDAEWSPVHLLRVEGEGGDPLGDRMPRSGNRDLFAIHGLALAPAAFQIARAIENPLEWFGIMARVKADEPHPALVNMGPNALGESVLDLLVARVTPPDEDVAPGEFVLRKALLGFVEADRFNAKDVVIAINLGETIGDDSANAVGEEVGGSVARVLVPDKDVEDCRHEISLRVRSELHIEPLMRRFLFPDTSSLTASLGLLILRLVTGGAMVLHGWPKMQSPTTWMGPDMPGYLRFLAAFAEFGGGLALILGLLTPLAALGIVCTMAVATWKVHGMGAPWIADKPGGMSFEPSLGYLAVGLLFLFAGPGAISLDALFFGGRRRRGDVFARH